MKPEARLSLALGLGAGLALALLLAGVRAARLSGETAAAAARSHELSRELAEMLAAANRLEAADRESLLFQRLELRTHAEAARTAFLDRFDKAAALAEPLPELRGRLPAIRRSFDEGVAAEERLLAGRLPLSGQGPMDGVRDALAQLALDQEALAVRAARRNDGAVRATVAGSALAALLVAAAVAFLYARVRRELAARERASADLRRVNLFLDATFESLPMMVFVKDAEKLSFVRVNRHCEELTGMTRAQLIGKTDLDYWPAEQALFFQSKDRATLASRKLNDILEEPIETTRGRRWLHTRKVPLFDSDGTPVFLLGISEDITDRKREAEELRAAKEAAEATSRELEAFSYSVSHDLRAPLRAIDGFSQALLEDNADQLDPPGQDSLRRVRAAAQRMGELIDDLLELSRVSRHELKREKVNLSSLSRMVLGDLQKQAPERKVTVEIEPDLTADCDARLLRVALENLFGNAWKFTSRKPSATISFGRKGGAFFVKDDGAGFEMQYAEKLFGAFQRLHGKHEFEGTGIGLATVQRIVHRHGGRIWAEAAPDRGATFHFTLG